MQHKKYTEGEELSADELESISETLIQAKFDRDKRKKWAQRLKEDYNIDKESIQKKPVFRLSKLAIAAMIACVFGIVTYGIITTTMSSYDSFVKNSIENLITIDNHAVVTRGDSVVDAQVLQAIEAYKTQQYDKSIERWKTIITSGKIQGFASYNIALCYLQKTPSSPEKAINYLIEARQTKTIQEEANWALALAYLDVNQKEKAKEVLQQIIASKSYKYKKAEALIILL
ncbi:hypothetical protein [uncultured Kordia sp.]|uniref:tetratricopeptide repeat protein n=1 Tax=uncultured Kordia sp. TaxID=507699 RepID=UPI00260C8A02|nr:hypothetical protein [uncultured Kordia sp.]